MTHTFLTIVKDIQNAVHQTYLKALDAAQVYEIKVKTKTAKHGNKTVIEYADMLKNIWQELNQYRCIETKCPKDATILKNKIEKDQVYDSFSQSQC